MEKWMTARLKYKTLVIVLSLLERRKDELITKRIMRSLPIDILKRNIAKIWKGYKKQYGTDFVNESLGNVILF
jgi:inositol 1,4,5-triphosphate receptor type 1/inositol 1,4,5-triphosphate receptor type 3